MGEDEEHFRGGNDFDPTDVGMGFSILSRAGDSSPDAK